MTELIVENRTGRIDSKKLDSIAISLKSWGIDTELKTTVSPTNKDKMELFAESFGMWADRDIDIKDIRKNTYERRTKLYDNGTL